MSEIMSADRAADLRPIPDMESARRISGWPENATHGPWATASTVRGLITKREIRSMPSRSETLVRDLRQAGFVPLRSSRSSAQFCAGADAQRERRRAARRKPRRHP